MENNPLAKYVGEKYKAVDYIEVKTATSKDGNPYCYVLTHYVNGYETRSYLRDAEVFAVTNAMDQCLTEKQMNAEL